jgi:hypothetical protein
MRDLGYADVAIGQQRLGGLDIVICEFRRTPSSATGAPGGRKARLGCALGSGCARIPRYAELRIRRMMRSA